MNITVKYFANMRDLMGRGEETVSIDDNQISVAELWEKISSGEKIPMNTLIAVNMEYTDQTKMIKNGDEVAFFPPVTGG